VGFFITSIIIISLPTSKISEFFLSLSNVYLGQRQGYDAIGLTFGYRGGRGVVLPAKCLLLLAFYFCSLGRH